MKWKIKQTVKGCVCQTEHCLALNFGCWIEKCMSHIWKMYDHLLVHTKMWCSFFFLGEYFVWAPVHISMVPLSFMYCANIRVYVHEPNQERIKGAEKKNRKRKKTSSQHNNKLMFNVSPGNLLHWECKVENSENVNGHKSTRTRRKMIAIHGRKMWHNRYANITE